MSDTDILIEAPKPTHNDLAPMYFYVTLLSLFGIPLLFIAFPAGFMFTFGALIVFLYFYTRISAVYEAFKIEGDCLQVIKGKRAIWKGSAKDIESVDVDTFSEFQAERGITMVVFYFKNGTSWSFSYTNYQNKQLKQIKSIIELIN
ncbi:MAG: hypothetical protein CL679_01440 [Bermanella sp.]|nr:hypothetical protein [Bermanella sp.]